MSRNPSASPVCYAEEKGIDPAYMWAQPKSKAKPSAMPARVKRSGTKRDAKR